MIVSIGFDLAKYDTKDCHDRWRCGGSIWCESRSLKRWYLEKWALGLDEVPSLFGEAVLLAGLQVSTGQKAETAKSRTFMN